MNTPITVIDNLYISFGADSASYIVCPLTDKALYYITDGHSQRAGSAELVKLFSDFFHNNIVLDKIQENDIEIVINKYLAEFQESVKRKFPRAAMCFVLVVRIESKLHIFHLGDCRLGKFDENNAIQWITKPHSYILQTTPELSEEELRVNEFNHVIFKQFSAIKFLKPDYCKVDLSNSKYILATDGFWKLLPEKQFQILNRNQVNLEDDVAFLIF
ncbi:hypothetical protein BUM88_18365 [Acinetobacter calcoaceticus]|uniref:hypothetical protein n=1 Tax=Acinetobacter calcoaceticus TaxID=471 RepID=UPI0009ADA3C3|nr:hypothetical protein [Acinetobacter calcoaceticus]AQZ83401.1 hypothetical protein BUM88_18365 [Acinetobacter calcoaceticus]